MALSENEVNRRYSRTWIKCNDDARSGYFRNVFIQAHGGEFVKNGKYWEWRQIQQPEPVIEPEITDFDYTIADSVENNEKKRYFIFTDQENKHYKVYSMKIFMDTYKLNKNNIYEVISGKRKSHKGFRYIKTIEPQVEPTE
jgi:hypothetical protein